MYEAYPSAEREPGLQRSAAPKSVLTAVKFMYIGAAANAIGIIITITNASSLKSSIRNKYPHLSVLSVHRLEVINLVGLIITGLLAIGLWIWMARENGSGKSWARTAATVLFGVSTLAVLTTFARPHSVFDLLIGVVVWIIGLIVVVLLWRKESSGYFQPG
jgi:hypothetical protein